MMKQTRMREFVKQNSDKNKTQIKDFVIPLLQGIKKLQPDKYSSNILVYVESQLAYEKLVNFLEKYVDSDLYTFLTNLRPFYDFLSERWFKIKGTDAIYCHSYTRANLAYEMFAQELSKFLNNHVSESLMPTVAAIIHHLSRDNLDDFKFHEFILGDDQTPIEVAKCLNDAAKNKTTNLFYTGIYKKPLSAEEKKRIIKHSPLSNQYYKQIERYVRHGFLDYLDAGKKFNEGIKDDNYVVTSSYGEIGQSRLAKSILLDMKTPRDFVNVLAYIVPQQRWDEFIHYMPAEELSMLFVNNDSLMKSLTRKKSYSENSYYNRAMLFCYVEVYWRRRAKGDRFSSLVGHLADYTNGMLGGFTKDQKEEGVKLLKEFLMSYEPFSNLEVYVKTHAKKEEYWKAIFEHGSNLALIAEQIKNLANPNYLHEDNAGLIASVYNIFSNN